MKFIPAIFSFCIGAFLLTSCNNAGTVDNDAPGPVVIKKKERKKPSAVTYHVEKAKAWVKKNDSTGDQRQFDIVTFVNRTDKANLLRMDSILVPDDLTGDREFYLPFPISVPFLKDVKKILFFSYPSQSFAAYEYGELAYTGPTNMGRKKDPTPEGLYYTNWKAEQTTSTFNDEWDLKWNFNIENKEGIGFHQYELPGYPASHSCLRLQEKDARFLYDWADQWVLKGTDDVRAKGTPVVVFGTYVFDAPKPWWQLLTNPAALDIPVSTLEQYAGPKLAEIIAEQNKRATVEERK